MVKCPKFAPNKPRCGRVDWLRRGRLRRYRGGGGGGGTDRLDITPSPRPLSLRRAPPSLQDHQRLLKEHLQRLLDAQPQHPPTPTGEPFPGSPVPQLDLLPQSANSSGGRGGRGRLSRGVNPAELKEAIHLSICQDVLNGGALSEMGLGG